MAGLASWTYICLEWAPVLNGEVAVHAQLFSFMGVRSKAERVCSAVLGTLIEMNGESDPCVLPRGVKGPVLERYCLWVCTSDVYGISYQYAINV